jgi:hypothetical protein
MLITLVVGWLWLRRQGRSERLLTEIAGRYAPAERTVERAHWLGRIARSEAVSRLVDESDRAMTAVLAAVLVGVLAFYGVRTFFSGSPLGPIAAVPGGWRSLIPPATWVCSMLPLTGLVVMYASFRNPGTRRRVGIIWDIATFWPRWFHPLAPPPYAARAVPELGTRLQRLTSEGAAVTLSGHSQGSVLAASSVVRIATEIVANLRLLTHGSPLGRLYGRFFPAYFGPSFMSAVHERLEGRWINLYRPTDAIGGPVGITSVDVAVPDPESDRRAAGDPLPAVRGHAFYAGSQAYDRALASLRDKR